MGEEQSLAALLAAACAAPLAPEQQQDLLAELVGADAAAVSDAVTAEEISFQLVEHNPLIAMQCLVALQRQVADYLPALLAAEISQNTLEVVHRLSMSVELPREFVRDLIANALYDLLLGSSADAEVVRTVSVFVDGMVSSGTITPEDVSDEARAFFEQATGVPEAAELLSTLGLKTPPPEPAGEPGPQAVADTTPPSQPTARASPPEYSLVLNWDGGPHGYDDVPQSMADFLERVFAPVIGTAVDALFWCVGEHTTRWLGGKQELVGDRQGREYASAAQWIHTENIRHMLERGEDPQAAIVERGRELGLAVWGSLRMNVSAATACHRTIV